MFEHKQMLKQYLRNRNEKVNINGRKRDYYEVLGVDRGADDATLKKHTVNWQKVSSGYEPGRQRGRGKI